MRLPMIKAEPHFWGFFIASFPPLRLRPKGLAV